MVLPLLVLSIAVSLPGFVVRVRAQTTVGITCYGYDGQGYQNNTLCPGSDTCCGFEATCLSNRLCHNVGDSPDTFVRGPCADESWGSSCPQICLYDETESNGLLPRVTPCADGSLCCSNNPQCCGNKEGVFLDATGNIVSTSVSAAITSYPPVSGTGLTRFTETPSVTTSASSTTDPSTTTTAGSTTAPTTTAAPTGPALAVSTTASSNPTISSTSSASSPEALQIGLGLGITLAVVVLACVVVLIIRWRRRRRQPYFNGLHGRHAELPPGQWTSPGYGPPSQPSLYGKAPPPVEMGPSPPNNGPYYELQGK